MLTHHRPANASSSWLPSASHTYTPSPWVRMRVPFFASAALSQNGCRWWAASSFCRSLRFIGSAPPDSVCRHPGESRDPCCLVAKIQMDPGFRRDDEGCVRQTFNSRNSRSHEEITRKKVSYSFFLTST